MKNSPRQIVLATGYALLLGAGSATSATSQGLPKDAAALIKGVHSAAASKDYAALKAMMSQEFVWSFGGDSDSNQAIEAWREDASYLVNLLRVTGLKCAYLDKEVVQCPAQADVDYRAGFKETESGWRMIYFVAGD